MKFYYHAGLSPTMVSPDTIYNIVDRTNLVCPHQQIEILTPMGQLKTAKSIPTLMAERTADIIHKSGNRKIAIAWSGGIDSTAILVEFLKLCTHSQIVVLMNNNSIREYPEFYRKYIEGQLETQFFDLYSDSCITDNLDCVFVTGALMDQTFGSALSLSLDKKLLAQPASCIVDQSVESQPLWGQLVSACPRELDNVGDLLWFMSYALSYQNEEMVWLLLSKDLVLEDNLFHFCTTADWNDYAVSTPSEIKWPGYDLINYKQPLREHIYAFTQDAYYRDNKLKVFSWRRYRTPAQRKTIPVCIDTVWKRGYTI